MIPYGKQDINQHDIDAVVSVLKSDYLTQGSQVPAFENAIAHYCCADYAVAMNSATSALHAACLALELGEGDVLWTSPITFVASANVGLMCGAQVDFVDIDPTTYLMCADALAQKLADAKRKDCLPKIVMPVHFAGQSCDMVRIHALSQEYGFRIIEDAAHAIGGCYQDRPIGSCTYSDISVFSFHPVKIITTAEGGVATTNQLALSDRLNLIRSHGVTRDTRLITQPVEGLWHYQQVALGFNYRMTDLQAALGVSQMARLDDFVARRHELAEVYHQALAGLPLILPEQGGNNFSSYHLFPVQVIDVKRSRRQVYDALRAKGLGVNVHYIPVHTQPFYKQFGFQEHDFPHALAYYQNAISIPLHQGLTDDEQAYVIACLEDVLA